MAAASNTSHADVLPRIRSRDISKHYDTSAGRTFALNAVSVDVLPGEMVVLLGPSGCGKTTLLRSIAGLEQPQAGEIFLDDHLVYSARDRVWVPPERRGISMVFQSYALWPHMTVRENLAYPLVSRKVPRAAVGPRVTQVMEAVGLSAMGDRYPSQLSGGQQQRVALARAIAAETRVVLFDEPLSNVDAKVRDQIRREIVSLQMKLGFSGLYVTHDQTEASALADRLVVMDHGRVAQFGTPSNVYDAPNTRYVATFMGPTNEFAGTVQPQPIGGYAQVATPIGPLLGVPRPGAGEAGRAVTVLFRPEACALGETRPEGPNTLPCTVTRRAFMGAMVELWLSVEVAGAVFQITALAPKHLYPQDSKLWMSIPPDSVWIFAE